jgi:hypothetical protein
MSDKPAVVIFTSSNVSLKANDNTLHFVQRVEVEDVLDPVTNEKYTNITLHRLVNDQEDVINDMRSGKFSFKIMNSSTNGGYISDDAEVSSFRMELTADLSPSPTELLSQKIVIKAKSFVYVSDARSESFKAMEKEDLENLIAVLKQNQEKALREKVAAVLPRSKVKSSSNKEKKKNKR